MENKNQTLTRAKIKEVLHCNLRLSQEESSSLMESIIRELVRMISKSEYLKIVSFGTFLIHHKKERIGRNPKTKVEAPICPRRSVSFRPSTILRHKVNP